MESVRLPYSQLEIQSSIPVIAGIWTLSDCYLSRTGEIIASTLNSPENVQESLKKSGPIRCAVLDNSNTHLATLADDKRLKVWKLDGLELLHERELPKRPTSAVFTVDGQTIVVADKFGDVFSYPLHPPPADSAAAPESDGSKLTALHVSEGAAPVEDSSTNTALETVEPEPSAEPSKKKRKSKKQKRHENPPTPRNSLASHVPTSNGTLVLGHTSLLTSFLLTPDGKYIVTADRDEHIRVSWFPQGFCIESFCLGHTQFVSAIHIPSAHPDALISGGGDAELKIWDWFSGKHKFDILILDSVKPYIKVKPKPYKRFASADPTERQSSQIEEINETEAVESARPESEEQLAVQKIRTLSEFILFTVTGGTALFAVAYPDGKSSAQPSVHALDFGKPVLDFTVDLDDLIWVSIDFNWSTEGNVVPEGKAIQVAKLSVDGQLANVSSTSSPVLDALNEKCLVEGSTEQLASLNFYSALTSLPKNTGEFDAEEEESGNATGTGIPKNIKTNTRKQPQGPGGGKKEQGKLRTQKAVAEKLGGQKNVDKGSAVVTKEEDEEEPNPKRLKSEDPATHEDVDVQMLDR
ncbi:WD40 repeat-like protein [Gymnopus androsaceus JB14]|uniref:WD40 repeat-like protein n=1 Tax=Gymnopus androsaceus JB14 TaxID=1447944 RepID=A0A6A4H4W2_9AGAR|nr:WD40 repeat-like protein [Gymnopus androsaceus JB14]